MSKRFQDDSKIWPSLCRPQKGCHTRLAPAIAYVRLPHAEAFRVGAVEIGTMFQAHRSHRFQKACDQRIDLRNVAHGHGPTDAMVRAAGERGIVFRAKKVRQQLGVAPASGTGGSPVVVIPGVTAKVHHAVGGARAAQHTSAREFHAPVVAMLLRHRLVSPAELWVENGEGHGGGHPDERVEITGAGLDQADSHVSTFAQAIGQYAARGACAHNDEVVALRWHGG